MSRPKGAKNKSKLADCTTHGPQSFRSNKDESHTRSLHDLCWFLSTESAERIRELGIADLELYQRTEECPVCKDAGVRNPDRRVKVELHLFQFEQLVKALLK